MDYGLVVLTPLLGILSLSYMRVRKKKEIRNLFYQERFRSFWLEGVESFEERRLATMSHTFRAFRRMMERGEELPRDVVRSLAKEAQLMAERSSGEMRHLFEAAARDFESLR